MQTQSSVIHSRVAPNAAQLVLDANDICNQSISELQSLGISPHIPSLHQANVSAGEYVGMTMDADPTAPLLAGSITTATQFAQQILPGLVRIVTAVRTIDRLTGVMTIGKWSDEQIIQAIVGNSGTPSEYRDNGNVPLANWVLNWERRTNVRFELGFTSGILEQELASEVRVANAAEKRYAVIEALEILRNDIGFFGFNNGANRTFGLFNDPELLDAETVAGVPWNDSAATFETITRQIIFMAATLQLQALGKVDMRNDRIIFAIPLSRDQFLNTTTTFNISVRQWLRETYPNWILEVIPQMDNFDNDTSTDDPIVYLFAETVSGSGTDDGRSIIQMVPQKFRTLGVEQRAKGYLEDSSNSTAGIMAKRPYAITRFFGI